MKFFSACVLAAGVSALSAKQEALFALQGVTGSELHKAVAGIDNHLQQLHAQMAAVDQMSIWVEGAHKLIQEGHVHHAGRKLGLAECVSQIASSGTKLLTCATQVVDAFKKTKDTTESGLLAFGAAITSYCDSGCAATIKAEIGTIIQSCSSKESREKFFTTKIAGDYTVNSLFVALNAPCYKAGTDGYCFPKYLKAFDQLKKSPPTKDSIEATTKVVLDGFCTPCTTGLFKLFATAGLSSTTSADATNFFNKGFKLFCLKEGADFCVVKTIAMAKLGSALKFSDVCTPCIEKYVAAAGAVLNKADPSGASFATVNAIMRFACQKTVNDKYCYQEFTGARITSLTTDCGVTDFFGGGAAPSCPAACKTTLTKLAADAGCCGGSLLVVWNALIRNSGILAPKIAAATDVAVTFKNFVSDFCSVKMFEPCTDIEVKTTRVIKNIRADFLDVVGQLDKIKTAIKQDIATLVNEPLTSIKLTSVANNTLNEITAVLSVVPTLQSQFTIATKLRAVDVWENLEAVVQPAARTSPVEAVVAASTPVVKVVDTKTGNDVPEPGANRASALSPSLSLSLAVAAVVAGAL